MRERVNKIISMESERHCKVVAVYMRQAMKEIDETFGSGYAASHPELIVAFIRTISRNRIHENSELLKYS